MGTSTTVGPPTQEKLGESDANASQVNGNKGTITASQLAIILSLVAGGIWYVVKMIIRLQSDDSNMEDVFAMQFYIVLLLTALYYVVSEWVTEEFDGNALRCLKYAKIEFWIRVFLAALLILVATGLTPEITDMLQLTPLHAQAFGLAVLYLFFLLWDLLVVVFCNHDLPTPLLWGDFVGGVLTLSLLWLHSRIRGFGFLVICVMSAMSALSMSKSADKFHLFQRMFKREMQT